MSGPAATAQHQQVAQKNLFWTIVTFPFTLFGVLVGSLLLSVIIEIIGMHLFWSEEGWLHAQQMFYYELEQFNQTFTQSIVVSEPVQTTHWLLSQVYEWVFVKTGLADELRGMVSVPGNESARKLTFKEYLNVGFSFFKNYALAAAFTVLTFFVRLMVLTMCLPLILLAVFVGLVDGLVRRDIRRFTAEHESGFMYHRAKRFLIPLIVLPCTVYLALPVSMSPLLVLIPGAVLLGFAVNITATNFKKYI